jgi:hypothetical protein
MDSNIFMLNGKENVKMEMPKIQEVTPFVDESISREERERAFAVRNLSAQYSSKGCSCSTVLGATTQHGCCYAG